MKTVRNNKPLQAAMVGVIAIAIVLAGAFAWYSFTQSALNVFEGWTNPDVNLHDDYEDGFENKDVYVENSGERPLYVRVRFEEFMQINDSKMYSGADKNSIKDWLVHNYMGISPENCANTADYDWDYGDIHDYYNWVLGGLTQDNSDPDNGQKYYLPAPFSKRALFDTKGNQMREPEEVTYYKNTYTERTPVKLYGLSSVSSNPSNWNNPAHMETPAEAYARIDGILSTAYSGVAYDNTGTGTEFLGGTNGDYLDWLYSLYDEPTNSVALRRAIQGVIDTFLEDNDLGFYDQVWSVKESVNAGPDTYSFKPADLEKPEIKFVPIKRTQQTEKVYTMAQWIAAGTPTGDFWIVDNDGWCYWGNILLPGQSTGLILSEVILNEQNPPAGTWWYGINVSLEAVTYDEIDKFWTYNNESGYNAEITEQGRMVLNAVSGQYVFDVVTNPLDPANPLVYTFFNNKDNTYRLMITDGSVPTYGPLFVYTGPIPPAENDLYGYESNANNYSQYQVGDTFTKDIPMGANNTTFTVLDAGTDISYGGTYGSGVIEVKGKRYIKLGYGSGNSNIVWLAVGPDGKFDTLDTSIPPKSTGDDILIWTDEDVLPGMGTDRYQEAADNKVKVGDSFMVDDTEWLVIGKDVDGPNNGKTLIITKYAEI